MTQHSVNLTPAGVVKMDAAEVEGEGFVTLILLSLSRKAEAGDGIVLTVADPADHSSWLGTVADVDTYTGEVTIDLM